MNSGVTSEPLHNKNWPPHKTENYPINQDNMESLDIPRNKDDIKFSYGPKIEDNPEKEKSFRLRQIKPATQHTSTLQ